jgi:hypothetical protein
MKVTLNKDIFYCLFSFIQSLESGKTGVLQGQRKFLMTFLDLILLTSLLKSSTPYSAPLPKFIEIIKSTPLLHRLVKWSCSDSVLCCSKVLHQQKHRKHIEFKTEQKQQE